MGRVVCSSAALECFVRVGGQVEGRRYTVGTPILGPSAPFAEVWTGAHAMLVAVSSCRARVPQGALGLPERVVGTNSEAKCVLVPVLVARLCSDYPLVQCWAGVPRHGAGIVPRRGGRAGVEKCISSCISTSRSALDPLKHGCFYSGQPPGVPMAPLFFFGGFRLHRRGQLCSDAVHISVNHNWILKTAQAGPTFCPTDSEFCQNKTLVRDMPSLCTAGMAACPGRHCPDIQCVKPLLNVRDEGGRFTTFPVPSTATCRRLVRNEGATSPARRLRSKKVAALSNDTVRYIIHPMSEPRCPRPRNLRNLDVGEEGEASPHSLCSGCTARIVPCPTPQCPTHTISETSISQSGCYTLVWRPFPTLRFEVHTRLARKSDAALMLSILPLQKLCALLLE